MKKLGVPYEPEVVSEADKLAEKQAIEIAEDLRSQGVEGNRLEQKQIVALIAYLQSLGQKAKKKESSGGEQ